MHPSPRDIKYTKVLEVPFLLCINSLKILQQMEVIQEKILATPSASVKGVYILAVVYRKYLSSALSQSLHSHQFFKILCRKFITHLIHSAGILMLCQKIF